MPKPIDETIATGVWYKPKDQFNDGSVVKANDGESFTLEELQSLVEGDIEIFQIGDGRIGVVNENGAFDKSLEWNIYGTMACGLISYLSVKHDVLVGNVFITEPKFIK